MQTKELYEIYRSCPSVCTDSRNAVPGSIFFALKGPNFNGNHYAKEAISKGCAYAVIDDESMDDRMQFIQVDDVLQTLQSLAKYHRLQFDIPILAITGSNGKTTTKELIKQVLTTKYKVHSTFANYNNHIGVPLTLLGIDSETEIAVVEIGTNQVGEVLHLSSIVNPTHGLISSIGKAHLEGLQSIDGVFKEKTGLYQILGKNKGCIFYDMDSQFLKNALPLPVEIVGYSTGRSLFYDMEIKDTFPIIQAVVSRDNRTYEIISSLYGNYNLLNISAALTVGIYFGIDMTESLVAIRAYVPENNRSQSIIYKGSRVYLDAYNANPTSVQLAIESFAQSKTGPKILILGDMLELGDMEEQEHLDIMNFVSQLNDWHLVIFVGPIYGRLERHVNPGLHSVFFDSCVQLKEWLSNKNWENKTILVKGSRGIGLENAFL